MPSSQDQEYLLRVSKWFLENCRRYSEKGPTATYAWRACHNPSSK